MRIALVHEFLTQLGGAERVLEAFHEIYPQAPVYTLVYDKQKTESLFEKWDIRPSFLQTLPGMPKKYKWYLPLMARATENFDLSGYDLIISDSSAFAKGIRTKRSTIHICYCHTPTRYLWESVDEYVKTQPIPAILKPAVKVYLKNHLKPWDYLAAQRPDFLIANSRTVQERIKKYYNRESEVIYPPADTEFFTPSPALRSPSPNGRGDRGEDYYFTASRLEPYKKIDIVIEAFNRLNLPLKVAGYGTQLQNLKSQSTNPKIVFLGRVSDEQLRDLYRGAKAFIFPSLEDAGIMVLESLSCGTPVIAFNRGGAAEFIRDGENGYLMNEQKIDSILTIVKKGTMHKFDPHKLRESVLEFDKEKFKTRIAEFIVLRVK